MKNSLRLLKSSSHVRIWFGASLQSWIGNGAAWPALALLANHRWHTAWAISLVLAADFLPSAFLGTFAGALADRHDRRRVMIFATLGSALSFGLIFLSSSYLILFLGALLAGTAGSFFSPASKSYMKQLAPKEDLPILSALRSFCQATGFTLGPALAGILLLFLSPRYLIGFDGFTFLLEAYLLTKLPAHSVVHTEETSQEEVGYGFRSGWKLTRIYPIATAIILTAGLGELFAPILNVALVPFAKHLLHRGNSSVGMLAAVTGLGLLAGSVLMARRWSLKDLRWVFGASWLFYGISLPLMAIAPFLSMALTMKFVQGLTNATQISSEVTLINGTVPDGRTGRVFGTLDAVNSVTFAISLIAAGALISSLGVAAALSIAGGGCVVASLIAFRGLSRAKVVEVAEAESGTIDSVLESEAVIPVL